MVKIELYDDVLLKNGKQASIVEILGDSYIVDIRIDKDYDTQMIDKTDVLKVLN